MWNNSVSKSPASCFLPKVNPFHSVPALCLVLVVTLLLSSVSSIPFTVVTCPYSYIYCTGVTVNQVNTHQAWLSQSDNLTKTSPGIHPSDK